MVLSRICLTHFSPVRPATLLKKSLWHRCFPVNFAKFLRTPFFTEHLGVVASERVAAFCCVSYINQSLVLEDKTNDLFLHETQYWSERVNFWITSLIIIVFSCSYSYHWALLEMHDGLKLVPWPMKHFETCEYDPSSNTLTWPDIKFTSTMACLRVITIPADIYLSNSTIETPEQCVRSVQS